MVLTNIIAALILTFTILILAFFYGLCIDYRGQQTHIPESFVGDCHMLRSRFGSLCFRAACDLCYQADLYDFRSLKGGAWNAKMDREL